MASICIRGGLEWILEKISSRKCCQAWELLPREVIESPVLEVFKRHVDVAPGDIV